MINIIMVCINFIINLMSLLFNIFLDGNILEYLTYFMFKISVWLSVMYMLLRYVMRFVLFELLEFMCSYCLCILQFIIKYGCMVMYFMFKCFFKICCDMLPSMLFWLELICGGLCNYFMRLDLLLGCVYVLYKWVFCSFLLYFYKQFYVIMCNMSNVIVSFFIDILCSFMRMCYINNVFGINFLYSSMYLYNILVSMYKMIMLYISNVGFFYELCMKYKTFSEFELSVSPMIYSLEKLTSDSEIYIVMSMMLYIIYVVMYVMYFLVG